MDILIPIQRFFMYYCHIIKSSKTIKMMELRYVFSGPMCTDPVDEGTGGEKHLKFHYDPESGVCTPFFYKGQGGNSNRYDSDKDCLGSCSEKYNEMYPSEGITNNL